MSFFVFKWFVNVRNISDHYFSSCFAVCDAVSMCDYMSVCDAVFVCVIFCPCAMLCVCLKNKPYKLHH